MTCPQDSGTWASSKQMTQSRVLHTTQFTSALATRPEIGPFKTIEAASPLKSLDRDLTMQKGPLSRDQTKN